MKDLITEMREMICNVNVNEIADHLNDESLFNWCGAWREEARRVVDDIERAVLTEAYKMVLNDMCRCNIFTGTYDAKNGNKHFIHGVETVMEYVASKAGDEEYAEFEEMFLNNIVESEIKAKGSNDEN